MKSLISCLIFIISPMVVLCQLPVLQWQKTYGGSDVDYPSWQSKIIVTVDSGYFIAGHSYSNDGNVSGNHGDCDFWIVRLDSAGQLLWQKSLGGSLGDYAESLQQTSDGGFIIVGSSESSDGDLNYNHGYNDVWVVKVDANGTIEWQHSYGGSDVDYGYSITQTLDGGYVVAGKTWSFRRGCQHKLWHFRRMDS